MSISFSQPLWFSNHLPPKAHLQNANNWSGFSQPQSTAMKSVQRKKDRGRDRIEHMSALSKRNQPIIFLRENGIKGKKLAFSVSFNLLSVSTVSEWYSYKPVSHLRGTVSAKHISASNITLSQKSKPLEPLSQNTLVNTDNWKHIKSNGCLFNSYLRMWNAINSRKTAQSVLYIIKPSAVSLCVNHKLLHSRQWILTCLWPKENLTWISM